MVSIVIVSGVISCITPFSPPLAGSRIRNGSDACDGLIIIFSIPIVRAFSFRVFIKSVFIVKQRLLFIFIELGLLSVPNNSEKSLSGSDS